MSETNIQNAIPVEVAKPFHMNIEGSPTSQSRRTTLSRMPMSCFHTRREMPGP